jgi:ABC-type sugar transport system ATPase subunit
VTTVEKTGERVRGDVVAARFTEVTKRYGATEALKGIDLEIRAGTVHALVGENGAGKSTALGVIAGRISPSGGRVELFGDEIPYGRPRALRSAGVAAVYQELTIAPLLSVEANVFLGQPDARLGFLKGRDMRKRYLELCKALGVAPQPRGTHAGRLSVADQQLLEIMRALVRNCRVILFDEPTASLAVPEREALYGLMRRLRERGITLVFVSHNLEEVLMLADAITVFREGRRMRTAPRAEWSKASLVGAMLGDTGDARISEGLLDRTQPQAEPTAAAAPRATGPADAGPPLLKAEGVTVPGAIEDIWLEVRRGEILGVAGLVGSGRTTLLRALAGAESKARGRLWIEGEELAWPRSVRSARKAGTALLPEDRKTEGLALAMASMDNVVLGDLQKSSRLGLLSRRRTERAAAAACEGVGFSRSRLSTPAMQLSGGNQQKLLLARWRHSPPKVLLADEPTRGVDIGAKAEIVEVLEEMAANGMAIIVVASELEELVALSHRVIVLSEGRVVAGLDRNDRQITVAEILHSAFKTGLGGDQ